MEKRHENSLASFLDHVFYEGFASKPKWQVTRWYGQSNFTVNVRRDLRERWTSLTEDLGGHQGVKLRLAEVDGTIIAMRHQDFFADKE